MIIMINTDISNDNINTNHNNTNDNGEITWRLLRTPRCRNRSSVDLPQGTFIGVLPGRIDVLLSEAYQVPQLLFQLLLKAHSQT